MENKLVGFVFEEGDEDWSLWLNDGLSKEDNDAITAILRKYEHDGYSVRNVYDELVNL